jgi:hypothetical protein
MLTTGSQGAAAGIVESRLNPRSPTVHTWFHVLSRRTGRDTIRELPVSAFVFVWLSQGLDNQTKQKNVEAVYSNVAGSEAKWCIRLVKNDHKAVQL